MEAAPTPRKRTKDSAPPDIPATTINSGGLSATSAVPGMTVAEVRSALCKLRKSWADSTPERPMFLSDVLANGMTLAEFCTRFQYGHHLKRHLKSSTQRSVIADAHAALCAKNHIGTRPGSAFSVLGAGAKPHSSATAAAIALSKCVGQGIPGPKGDAGDLFPFTPGWQPRTEEGRRAFAERGIVLPPLAPLPVLSFEESAGDLHESMADGL